MGGARIVVCDVDAIGWPVLVVDPGSPSFVYPSCLAMSIFSKLFPNARDEGEASSSTTPAGAGEEGPTMKRSPSDGRAAPSPGEGRAGPPANEAKAPPVARPEAQGARPGAPPLPRNAAVRPPTAPQPAAPTAQPRPPQSPPAVTITRPIDVGPAPSSASPRSRPAMPAIVIGPPMPAPAPAPPPAAAGSVSKITQPLGSPIAARPPAAEPATVPEPPPSAPSVRPPAPAMAAQTNGGHSSIADTFERLLSADDVDASLESLGQVGQARPEGAPAPRAVAPSDLAEVRSLFAQLAANHVRPVRDFVMDLRWSDATADWLPICQPALRSLRRAAEKLELGEVCVALDRFGVALAAAQGDGAATVAGPRRQEVLAQYEVLSRVLPQAFALDLDSSQREAVILQSLLLQVPEVKKVTLDKMIAAGLSTLEAMLLATPSDLTATAGIPLPIAERIVQRFRAYRDQVRATVPDATRAKERERLAELTRQLRAQHEQYEQTSQAWSRDAADRKKGLRKAREQTLLDIQVELARLGEVDRLAMLERLPFDAKLAQLESFLEEARDKYKAQP